MASAVYAQGKRAISHGICPSVGIGGHATHGGWGYSSRAWGLTIDHIVELQVVLANGTEARASADTNTDLFWVSNLYFDWVVCLWETMLTCIRYAK